MAKKKNDIEQLNLFDEMDTASLPRSTTANYYGKAAVVLNDTVLERLKNYNLELYIEDLNVLGLELTWDYVCEYVLTNGENANFLRITNFGEMYEIGLAVRDKILKKKSGQYYTPDDIASVMGEWLDECSESNVCDVACGTGKLILTYLNLIGEKRAKELITSGKIYLYDFDHIALKICKTAIIVKYGIKDNSVIHDVYCDFLDPLVKLPENSRVISNPPYAGIDEFATYWKNTPVLVDTKELYSAFMEKIFFQAESTVIITPFSFISGNKFYSLRKQMCEIGYGFVVAFDNVPGNIFCGRKHGVFNTNTANSVRAAITVLHKSDNKKGFRITPLIRFKNEERKDLLKARVLERELPVDYQIVNKDNKMFIKIFKDLDSLYKKWLSKSSVMVKDVLSKNETSYFIDMPNTCRYYTTAAARKLSRGGSISMFVKNEETFDFLYCFINSSFTYWWWRIFDGGITYPVNLLNSMPLPLDCLSDEDKLFFKQMRTEMSAKENEFIVTKVNAGVVQENIKFPEEFRNKINERLLKILNSELTYKDFNKVHANSYYGG